MGNFLEGFGRREHRKIKIKKVDSRSDHLIPLSADSGQIEGLYSKEESIKKLKASIVSPRTVLACENGSTVRVTIRLRKKEAAFLLGIDGGDAMKKLLHSLSLSTTMERFPEWKPSLEPIYEDLTSFLHPSTSTQI